MDLKETHILGSNIGQHWYYQTKAKAMLRLLTGVSPSIILDVGAGSGFFSRTILSQTLAMEAWCVDPSYKTDSDTLEAGKPLHFRRSVDKNNADLVLLMDVLEHVDDDVGLLQDYVRKVPSRARFLISVPAFQFLWSEHDLFLEHKRRYRLNQIEDVARKAGLKVKLSAYYFGAVFPIAASLRLLGHFIPKGQNKARSQLSEHHRLVNGMLAGMSILEMPLLKHNRLFGLTAFCLAESV